MKKILIGLSVGLGVVAVATAATLPTIHFVKKNKKPQTPSTPVVDEKDVDAIINKANPTIKSGQENVFASTITADNLKDHVDNLPTTENGVTVELKADSISADDQKGELKFIYTFKKGAVSKEKEFTISGFKDEKEKLKQDFITALENSTFTKPIKFALEVAKAEQQEATIITALQTKWSGKANAITIKKVGSEHVVTLNSNTNTYTNNIYSKVWKDIQAESENADFKNIKQVSYGFRITKVNDTQYQLVPTYTQVAFATQPTWLDENQESVRVSLLKNKALISTITVKQN